MKYRNLLIYFLCFCLCLTCIFKPREVRAEVITLSAVAAAKILVSCLAAYGLYEGVSHLDFDTIYQKFDNYCQTVKNVGAASYYFAEKMTKDAANGWSLIAGDMAQFLSDFVSDINLKNHSSLDDVIEIEQNEVPSLDGDFSLIGKYTYSITDFTSEAKEAAVIGQVPPHTYYSKVYDYRDLISLGPLSFYVTLGNIIILGDKYDSNGKCYSDVVGVHNQAIYFGKHDLLKCTLAVYQSATKFLFRTYVYHFNGSKWYSYINDRQVVKSALITDIEVPINDVSVPSAIDRAGTLGIPLSPASVRYIESQVAQGVDVDTAVLEALNVPEADFLPWILSHDVRESTQVKENDGVVSVEYIGEKIDASTGVLNSIKSLVSNIIDLFKDLLNFLKGILNSILGLLKDILNAIKAIPATITDAIVKAYEKLFEVPADVKINFDVLKIGEIKDVFPFCIPFDFYNSIKVFSASASDPDFKIEMDTSFFSVNHTIDLTPYALYFGFLRYTFVAWFTMILILKTKDLIKW